MLYNLGLAYKGMGHPDKAQEAFESYVKFADPKKEGKTINAVKAEIERMKNGYARYALKLTPANAQILIDGAPATASDGELWVATGSHKIAFKADGYEDYEQTLDVSAGRFDLEVNLRQAGPADLRAAQLIEDGIGLRPRPTSRKRATSTCRRSRSIRRRAARAWRAWCRSKPAICRSPRRTSSKR